ncbi:MAG: DHH family phosphoesterase [Oscillospiraceae bacterium]
MKNFYKSKVLLYSLCTLIAFLLALDIYVFRTDPVMFWVSLPFLVAVSGIAIGKLVQIRRSEYWYFEQLTSEIRGTDSMSLIGFPLPVAMVDEDRCIIWSNDCFNESFFLPGEDESSVDVITDEPLVLFSDEGREIQYGDRWYHVYSDPHEFVVDDHRANGRKSLFDLGESAEESTQRITILIFRDITEYKQLQLSYDMSRPVVMIIMVDNYEELLGGARESDRAYVTIQVDRLIEEYFAERTAMLRKISNDKFLVVVENRYVREMTQEKMPLINKAHEIVVKDKGAVTLSIGIGATAKTFAEGEQFASEMLDKALERGGDQALLKTANGFIPYGASSPGKERTGKVKIRFAAENIKALISTADTVYIMGHSYGDFDSVGAAIGLTCAIKRLGIPAYAVVRQNPAKTNALSLIQRFSDRSIFQEPETAFNEFTRKSVLIIVDTHIEKKVEDQELLHLADKSRVIIIDHHRLSAGAISDCAVKVQESNASSASELVTELIQYFSSDTLLNSTEAEALLAGITLDTKDFVMRAGVSTFEAAAYLKKIGADTISVKKLFDTTIENKTKKAEIISSAEIYHKNCAIAVVDEVFDGIRVICSQAADEMLYIKNVDASFTVYPVEGGWSFSARSLGKVNVQMIMESIGNKKDDGGGHQSMAGAQLYGITRDEAVEKLHRAIDEYFSPVEETQESEQ